MPAIVSCENVRSTITSTQRSRLCAMSLSFSRASSRLCDWSTNIAVPPRLVMPASKVSRVRSDGFSKNITICFPASDRWKTEGRDFISSARCNTASHPLRPRSRVETRSGHQKTPGNVSGAEWRPALQWTIQLLTPLSRHRIVTRADSVRRSLLFRNSTSSYKTAATTRPPPRAKSAPGPRPVSAPVCTPQASATFRR